MSEPMTPMTPKRRRALDRRVERKHSQFRKRFKEVRGKKVDWITHGCEENYWFVSIRFMDGTNFYIQYSPQFALDVVELTDMKPDPEKVLQTYHKRKDL